MMLDINVYQNIFHTDADKGTAPAELPTTILLESPKAEITNRLRRDDKSTRDERL